MTKLDNESEESLKIDLQEVTQQESPTLSARSGESVASSAPTPKSPQAERPPSTASSTPSSRPSSAAAQNTHSQATQTLLQSTSYDILSEQLAQTRQTLLSFQKQHQNTLNSLRKHSNVSKVETEERKVLRRQVDFFKQLALEYERQVNGGMENDLFELRKELGSLKANNLLLTQELLQEREKSEQLQKELDDLKLTNQSQKEELDMIAQREASLILEKHHLTEQLIDTNPEAVEALNKELEQLKLANLSLKIKLKTTLKESEHKLLSEARKLAKIERSLSAGFIDTALVKKKYDEDDMAQLSQKRRNSLPTNMHIGESDMSGNIFGRDSMLKNTMNRDTSSSAKQKGKRKVSPLNKIIMMSQHDLTVSPGSPSAPLTQQFGKKKRSSKHLSAHHPAEEERASSDSSGSSSPAQSRHGSTKRSRSRKKDVKEEKRPKERKSSKKDPNISATEPKRQRKPSANQQKQQRQPQEYHTYNTGSKAERNVQDSRERDTSNTKPSQNAHTQERSPSRKRRRSPVATKPHMNPETQPRKNGLQKASSYKEHDGQTEEQRAKRRQGLHPIASVNDIDRAAQQYEEVNQAHRRRSIEFSPSPTHNDAGPHQPGVQVNGYVDSGFVKSGVASNKHFPPVVHNVEAAVEHAKPRHRKHVVKVTSKSNQPPQWERQQAKYVSKLHTSMDLQEYITSNEVDESVVAHLHSEVSPNPQQRMKSEKRPPLHSSADQDPFPQRHVSAKRTYASAEQPLYMNTQSPSANTAGMRREGSMGELPFELPSGTYADEREERSKRNPSAKFRLVQPVQQKDKRSLYRGRVRGEIVEMGRFGMSAPAFPSDERDVNIGGVSALEKSPAQHGATRLIQRQAPQGTHQMQQHSADAAHVVSDSPQHSSEPTTVPHTYRRLEAPHFPQRQQKPLNFRGGEYTAVEQEVDEGAAEPLGMVLRQQQLNSHVTTKGRGPLRQSESHDPGVATDVEDDTANEDSILEARGFVAHPNGAPMQRRSMELQKVKFSTHQRFQFNPDDESDDEIREEILEVHAQGVQQPRTMREHQLYNQDQDVNEFYNQQHQNPHEHEQSMSLKTSLDDVKLMVGSNLYHPAAIPRKKITGAVIPKRRAAKSQVVIQPGSVLGASASQGLLSTADLRIDNRKVRTPASPPQQAPKRKTSPPANERLYELSKVQKQESTSKLPKTFSEEQPRLSKTYGASSISQLLNYTEG